MNPKNQNFLKKKKIGTYLPLLITLIAFTMIILTCFFVSLNLTEGKFIYPFDDTYIHLTMARNLSEYGIWGVERERFTSTSSSLLWTSLLSALNLLLGENEMIALFLSISFSFLLLFWVFLILKKKAFPLPLPLIILFSIIFFAPLPAISMSGLEHAAHTLFAVAFSYSCADALHKRVISGSSKIVLLSLALLLTLTRYEGIFLVFITGLLFILRKRPRYAFLLWEACALPIGFYGLLSLSKGWYFFPNSVFLKGNSPHFFSWRILLKDLIKPWEQFLFNPHLSLLILSSFLIIIILWSKNRSLWHSPLLMNLIFSGTSLLHIQFARVGLIFRYEAYLIVLGILAISFALVKSLPSEFKISATDKRFGLKNMGLFFLILVTIIYLLVRGILIMAKIPRASKNIFEQQYQMSLFLKEFYPEERIAANDIGAISYFGNVRCLDLWGLATLEVARAKRKGIYGPHFIRQLARTNKVKVAVVYDSWYLEYGGLPPEWVRVEKWRIPDNVICGDESVYFYATEPQEEERLRKNLEKFSNKLPEDVERKIYY